MKNKFCVKHFLALILFITKVAGEEDPVPTDLSTTENPDSNYDGNREEVYSSSEKAPDLIGMPQPESKPHHHQKHKNPTDGVQSHTRSPVYEVVNQPCYSPGCGGYGPQDAYPGNRWQPGRNRYGPYPRYEPRRRGGYREIYPAPGYGPNYAPAAPPYPDYGYGARGMPVYPPNRYERFGGYGRPPYDDYFLG